MADPKVGMHHEDVRKRVIRMVKEDKRGNVKNQEQARRVTQSLLNQARLSGGEGSVREIIREIKTDHRG